MRVAIEVIAIALVVLPTLYGVGRLRVKFAKWKPVIENDGSRVAIRVRKSDQFLPVQVLDRSDPDFKIDLNLALSEAKDTAKELNQAEIERN